jgi:hypothetical protein
MVLADFACNKVSNAIQSAFLFEPPYYLFWFTFSKRFSTVSKSFNCNSISIVSLSRIDLHYHQRAHIIIISVIRIITLSNIS